MFPPQKEAQGWLWPFDWCVPLCLCPVHSSHVVLWVCLPSCSKLPIHSVCHGLAQHTQRVAFVCSQPCPVSICYWDGLQRCHHPNQNKWTFVCCLLLNLTQYVPEKHGESKRQRAQLLHFCWGHAKAGHGRRSQDTEQYHLCMCSEYLDRFLYMFPQSGFSPGSSAPLHMVEQLLPLSVITSA